jgi:hypothetical protein
MSPVILDLPRAPMIEAPQHPALARLWALARAKFETREGRAPASRDDWRVIVRDYDELRRKTAGSIAQVIEARCAEQPGGT